MMQYVSTRNTAHLVGLDEAITAGLAPDGGLYVPTYFPKKTLNNAGTTLADTAIQILQAFFSGSSLAAELDAICHQAFNFPLISRQLSNPHHQIIELFHGPTAAFKDFGARFLSACMRYLTVKQSNDCTILVATSGDTGAAVAAAFHRQPGIRVVILYPQGRVSARQEHQLGCFGDNVTALQVQGSFDDCQSMVKSALGNAELQKVVRLSSANSISLGRLLPQMCYYAHSCLRHYHKHNQTLNYIIPTGNLGNALAAMWLRKMGYPIGKILLATNANKVLSDYMQSGVYQPRASTHTIANAMDVGAPSNFERFQMLFPSHTDAISAQTYSDWVDDKTIQKTIADWYLSEGVLLCPHTATAAALLTDACNKGGAQGHWAIMATAHSAKFPEIVEPIIDHAVSNPESLEILLQRPSHADVLPASQDALHTWLRATSPK